MSRNVTITLMNRTRSDWTDPRIEMQYGEFHEEPPYDIGAGGQGRFRVGNSGDEKDLKGSITYSMGNGTRVLISWDHSYSASRATYTCVSEPSGKIETTLRPNNPKGNDQKIVFIVVSARA